MGFLLFLALSTINALLHGWVLSVLWGWFFVPTLGLPELSVVHAIGIGVVVSYLTYQYNDTEDLDRSFGESVKRNFSFSVIRSLFALTFGWVVHSFM